MLQLTPSASSKAKENLAAYIEKAKLSDLLKSEDAPKWDSPTWDVLPFTKRPNATASAKLLQFRPIKKTKGGSNTNSPYGPTIGDTLKAYVVFKIDERFGSSNRPANSTVVDSVRAIRGMVDTLVDQYGLECLTEVQAWQIEEYLTTVKDHSVYAQLKKFLIELRDQNILPQIIGLAMKAPSRRQVGNAAASGREPTTWDEIVALGRAFHQVAFAPNHASVDPGTRFWTSCATLLATTPSRETELWRLPANLEVVNDPASVFGPEYAPLMYEDESFKYGLRWWPAKGGRPTVKFVPTPMVKVSQRAVEIIKEYSDEPRKLAKWIIDNPGKLPIPEEHSDIEECRKLGVITGDQIKRLFGMKDGCLSNIGRWKNYYKKTRATMRRSGNNKTKQVYSFDFNTFEEDWKVDFERNFPTWPMVVHDNGLKLRADEALMVCFNGALDPTVVNKSKIFLEIPKQRSFSSSLSASEKHNYSTIFERLEIRLPDGSYPRIQSHDLRHFLNTMAQRAGVPQKLIAAWSGRREVGQNMVYDHRTDEERVKSIGAGLDYDALTSEELMHLQMGAFRGEIAPPSTIVLSAEQSNFNEIRKKLFISVTQSGFCLGDLREELCPSAQHCISCSRHMICAGAEKSTAIFREQARIMNLQHQELKKQLDAGRPGVTKEHVEHMAAQCQGANGMLLALNDPETVDGTPILRLNYTAAQRTRFSDRVNEHRGERLAMMSEKMEITHA